MRYKYYSVFSGELLTTYLSRRHFIHLLEGRNFTLFTDHKPLVYAIHSKTGRYNPCDVRQLDNIEQFTSDIRHIQGNKKIIANTLSRASLNTIKSQQLDLDYFARKQRRDNTMEELKNSTSLLTEQRPILFITEYLFYDVSIKHPRRYVTPIVRRYIFDYFHSMPHPSRKTSVKLISERFIWANMSADIAILDTNIKCQISSNTLESSLPGNFPAPGRRFKHIHVDLV